MTLTPLARQLLALKMMYEDALLQKAAPEEIKKILQRIDEINKEIANAGNDSFHGSHPPK